MKSTLEIGEICRVVALNYGADLSVFAGPNGILLEMGEKKATITPLEIVNNSDRTALGDLVEAKLRAVGLRGPQDWPFMEAAGVTDRVAA